MCLVKINVSTVLLFITVSQNENVERASTSERLYWDIRRPDRRTPMKVLVEKTYLFTKCVWALYIHRNKADLE